MWVNSKRDPLYNTKSNNYNHCQAGLNAALLYLILFLSVVTCTTELIANTKLRFCLDWIQGYSLDTNIVYATSCLLIACKFAGNWFGNRCRQQINIAWKLPGVYMMVLTTRLYIIEFRGTSVWIGSSIRLGRQVLSHIVLTHVPAYTSYCSDRWVIRGGCSCSEVEWMKEFARALKTIGTLANSFIHSTSEQLRAVFIGRPLGLWWRDGGYWTDNTAGEDVGLICMWRWM